MVRSTTADGQAQRGCILQDIHSGVKKLDLLKVAKSGTGVR